MARNDVILTNIDKDIQLQISCYLKGLKNNKTTIKRV